MGCGASNSNTANDSSGGQKNETPVSGTSWTLDPSIDAVDLASDDVQVGQPSSYIPRTLVQHFLHNTEKLKPLDHRDWTLVNAALCVVDISGYTKMNEHFAQIGPAGVEKLSSHLKKYFTQLIDIIHAHGGDVVKFAGDALFVVFANDPFDRVLDGQKHATVVRAVQASLQLQQDAGEYRVDTSVMTLHVAVGVGDVRFLVCGVDEEEGPHTFECFLAGACMDQIATAVDVSKSGQVVVSADAWALSKDYMDGKQVAETGEVLINSVTTAVDIVPIPKNIRVPKAAGYNIRCFVPRPVLEKLDAGQAGYMAELRRISVMFVNLEGLHLGAGVIDTSKVATTVKDLNTIIKQNDGYRRQFMRDDKGTVLIVAWGLPPYVHEDDQYRAVKCGLQMSQYLQQHGIKHSLGITTGNVFTGSPGSDDRHEHGVIGDTVNASARLAFTPRKGNFLVDEHTQEAVQDRVSLKSEGSIKVKGKDMLMSVFRPLAIKSTRSKTAVKDVIGRDVEIGKGRAMIDNFAKNSKGGVLVVRGPAGSGKSVVLNKLREATNEARLLAYDADGDETEINTAFFIFRRLVSQILGLQEDMTPAERRAAAEKASKELPEDLQLLFPLINHVLPDLGIPDTPKSRQFVGDSLAAMINQLLTGMIRGYSTMEPTVLFLEDAQFICNKSWGLLQSLSQDADSILIFISTRPVTEDSSDSFKKNLTSLTDIESVQVMDLSPFDKETTLSLLKSRLEGVETVDDKVLSFVLERSHGNPLYSVELATALLAAESLRIEHGQLTPGASFGKDKIPTSLQGLIAQRVEKMGADEQLLCKLASVFGREFMTDALKFLHEQEQSGATTDRFEGLMSALSTQGILNPGEVEDAAHKEAAFRHVFIQQACYDVLLYSQKAKLHKMIGEWLETKFPGDAAKNHVGALAFHYLAAVETNKDGADPETVLKACKYLDMQADECLATGAMSEAAEVAKHGVQICTDEKSTQILRFKFQFLLKCGSAMQAVFGFTHPEVLGLYEEADRIKDLLPKEMLGSEVVSVMFLLRLYQCITGDYAKSCPNGELMYRTAQMAKDSFGMFTAGRAMSQCRFVKGDPDNLEKWNDVVIENYVLKEHGHNYKTTGGVDGYTESCACRAWHCLFRGDNDGYRKYIKLAGDNADAAGLIISQRFVEDFHFAPVALLEDYEALGNYIAKAKYMTPGAEPMTLYDYIGTLAQLVGAAASGEEDKIKMVNQHLPAFKGLADMVKEVAVPTMYVSALISRLLILLGGEANLKEAEERADFSIEFFQTKAAQNTVEVLMVNSAEAKYKLGRKEEAVKMIDRALAGAKERTWWIVAGNACVHALEWAKAAGDSSRVASLKDELREVMTHMQGDPICAGRVAAFKAALA